MRYIKTFESFNSIIAYRAQRIDHNPPNGSSGHFNGTYFFIGAEQKAKDWLKGSSVDIIKADITNAKIYQLYGEEGNTHDSLKKDANKAGYDTFPASGYGECEYLKKLGYDGIKIGNEVVLFDAEKFIFNI